MLKDKTMRDTDTRQMELPLLLEDILLIFRGSIFKVELSQDVVVHVLIPTPAQRLRQEDHHGFEASKGYTVSFGPD